VLLLVQVGIGKQYSVPRVLLNSLCDQIFPRKTLQLFGFVIQKSCEVPSHCTGGREGQVDLDVLSEQTVIPTAGGHYLFFLFRGYMKMLWMTLGMEVPAGYGAVSDWGQPEYG